MDEHLQVAASALRLGDELGGLEGSSNLRIQHDVHVVVVSELLVALMAAACDPLLEGRPDTSINDITDVGAGHLSDLLDNGEGVDDDPVGEAPVDDLV